MAMDADDKIKQAEQVRAGRDAGDLLERFALKWFDGIKEETLVTLGNCADERNLIMIRARYAAAANLIGDLKAASEKGKRAAKKLKEEATQ
jgi:hypothetical protein